MRAQQSKLYTVYFRTMAYSIGLACWGTFCGTGKDLSQSRQICFNLLTFCHHFSCYLAKYKLDKEAILPPFAYPRGTSWVWRGILSTFIGKGSGKSLHEFFQLHVGDGAGPISEFGLRNEAGWSWNIPLRRVVFDWERCQWEALMRLLASFVGSASRMDGVKRLAPFKVEAFVWRVLRRRVLVRVELGKRGVSMSDSRCTICLAFPKSVDHLFFSCAAVWRVWESFLSLWDIATALPIDPVCFIQAKYPSISFSAESLAADLKIAKDSTLINRSSLNSLVWIPPSIVFLKFNIDGSMRTDGSRGGIGGILRDSSGSVLASFSVPIGGVVVNWLRNPSSIPPEWEEMLRSMTESISKENFVAKNIPRIRNSEADQLEKLASGYPPG
ncbi:hypothetical protein F3Y22_tig00110393pilonHSYRG00075 [Hibiscus syriacus]|uniref:Reverse transcriptase zinc-binding domain-containing protein n=1 Tax=Hibiscus syriacus TaxID=106335 RepID=A0A6A3ARH1_HIBSY|nr:hypothetical protein F3Y22_tig00110393pilonHSYRG00075 [Hibiscus syriacus]